MSGLAFVLLDATGGAGTSDGGKLTPAVLGQLAALLTVYACRDVAGEYGIGAVVRAGASVTDIQAGEIPFVISATLADVPSAIAYHDVTSQGAPDAFDAITLSDSLMGPGNSLLVALSHEVAETIGDAGCNLIAIDGNGKGYAREASDPVEENSYPLSITVAGVQVSGYVSDFVLQSYFVPNAPGPYNFMAKNGKGGAAPPAPLTVAPSGGANYQIEYSSVTGQGQVTGYRGTPNQKRLARKQHPTSRTSRRGLRL